MATTQYASYERTATVKTFAYTATVVTEAGKTTATLTARADPEWGSRRREVKCPGCPCWYTLYWNVNLQQYEPVHCTGCCISLYDIHIAQPAPATVETPEPAAVEVAEPVASIEVPAPATQAEPGPVEEPAPLKPVRSEQKAYFVTWVRDEHQKAKYCLLHRKNDGMACDCSCPDRKYRGRKNGRCCKHMTAHNAMLKSPTEKQKQEAA